VSGTTTNAAAARAALLGENSLLRTLPGLAEVAVAYSLPGAVPRELVYGGQAAGAVTLAAMKGGAGGRIKREENLSLQIHIRVNMPGQTTTEASDARAVEIGAAIEEYIAGNPTLDDMPGMLLAAVEAIELDPGGVDDEGATSELTLQIALKSYLA
jgi:hypothetical protein